jgi:uncharacterized protein
VRFVRAAQQNPIEVSMTPINISREIARKLAIHAQLLNQSRGNKDSIISTIHALGYVQIDTIAVIERAHHHTLWMRHPDYSPEALHKMQSIDRSVFEFWTHAMSYIPMADYRFYIPKMRNFENPASQWALQGLAKCRDIMPAVLDRIRQEGPLSAKDFVPEQKKKGGTWWDWKPAKLALELLLWRGNLMVTERRNFNKIYDLTERVLPDNIDTRIPSPEELGRFVVQRALSSFGVARETDIRCFLQPDTIRDADMQLVTRQTLTNTLLNMMHTNEVVPVHIEDDETINYALAETVSTIDLLNRSENVVSLLSPFDNLIIQRDRTKRLFDFNYTLECYVPEPKRKFGYFVLPILWNNRFVGRLDPKADRKQKQLLIQKLTFEPDVTNFDELLPSLASKLMQFQLFNGCNSIVLKDVQPAKLKKALSTQLAIRS